MKRKKWLSFTGLIFVVLLGFAGWFIRDSYAAGGNYKILAWNDLGMHCYSRDFADLAVLPPYNNLWVQVVKVGDPPELVTSGITVEYYYADNTYSVGKTNFWDYDLALFGVNLPANVGLKGKGLSGSMDLSGDHFVAEGIPITEYSDSAPTTRQPYQLATVVVKDATTGTVLTSSQVVTPTSSEMRCDNCHGDSGIARPSVPTGKVETNILKLHDENSGTTLMNTRPVLCASCHSSNALGASGKPGIKSLSKSMHEQHASIVPSTLDGCYNCHPGPQTRCLRDVMSTEEGMTCVSCHGGLATVSNNPNPWLNEPRCDTCHNSGQYNQDRVLYRFSKGHGGLYCESCHDSTHAVAPSREANDAIKFNQLQGRSGPLQECSVCHANVPPSGGPHVAIPPHVNSVLRANPSPTSLPSVNYTVSFSGTVTGVDTSDFHLTATGVNSPSVSSVTGSGSTYTVTVNTGSGSGTIRLDVVDNDSILNGSGVPLGGAGTGNGGYTAGEVYTVQKNYTFADVPDTYWAWSYIEQVYKTGITGGCSTSPMLYCPTNPVTRAQMAVFLLRAEHGPGYTPPAATGVFTDVPITDWTAPWIEQLASENITGGCSLVPKKYCPNSAITRAQMSVFLLRAEHGSTYTPPAAIAMFADVPVTDFTAPYIEQLANEKITSGCGGGNYCPAKSVTRDQMAIFLMRAFALPMP